MEKIFLLIIITLSFISAKANEKAQLKTKILKKSGIKEGHYRLVAGEDRKCPYDGDLILQETEDGYSYMMGAILFMGYIGSEPQKYKKSENCSEKISVSIKDKTLISRREEKCDKNISLYNVEMKKIKSGFTIKRSYVGFRSSIQSECKYYKTK